MGWRGANSANKTSSHYSLEGPRANILSVDLLRIVTSVMTPKKRRDDVFVVHWHFYIKGERQKKELGV